MSDLISRQAAIDALGEKPLAWTEGEYELGLQNQWQSDVDALNGLPSAQPEREKGQWIEVEVFSDSYDIYGNKTWSSEMQCNRCGFRHTAIEGHMAQYNFCPNCGADMRGEEDG